MLDCRVMEQKFCGCCKTEKTVAEFSKDRRAKDKLQTYCKVCMAAKQRLWLKNNRQRSREYRAKYYRENSEAFLEKNRIYYNENFERIRERNRTPSALERLKKWNASKRRSALEHLGGSCCRCGFSDERALQIDHIHGGGTAERNSIGNSGILANVLASTPGEVYQLLCANCNWIKKAEKREAPTGPRQPRRIIE